MQFSIDALYGSAMSQPVEPRNRQPTELSRCHGWAQRAGLKISLGRHGIHVHTRKSLRDGGWPRHRQGNLREFENQREQVHRGEAYLCHLERSKPLRKELELINMDIMRSPMSPSSIVILDEPLLPDYPKLTDCAPFMERSTQVSGPRAQLLYRRLTIRENFPSATNFAELDLLTSDFVDQTNPIRRPIAFRIQKYIVEHKFRYRHSIGWEVQVSSSGSVHSHCERGRAEGKFSGSVGDGEALLRPGVAVV